MKTKLLLLGFFVTIQTEAATRTWVASGIASPRWSTPGNWTPLGTPQPGDTLVFDTFSQSVLSMVNDLNDVRVSSLRFNDGDYTLNGNSLTVSNSITVGRGPNSGEELTATINATLILGGNVSCLVNEGDSLTDRNNQLFLRGTINLNGFQLRLLTSSTGEGVVVNRTSEIYVTGVIAGTGSVHAEIANDCRVVIGGPSGNTFSGPLSVTGRNLRGSIYPEGDALFLLDKDSGPAVNTRLEILPGDSQIRLRPRLNQPHQIADGATLMIGAGQQFDFNGHSDWVTHLEMQDGALLTTGSGTLIVLDRISAQAGLVTPIIRGRLSLLSALTCELNPAGGYYGLDIQAAISGAAFLTKTGTAALKLSGDNTFTGAVIVESGDLQGAHVNAFGNPTGGVLLEGGAVRIDDLTISGEPIHCNRDGSDLIALGNCAWNGSILLTRTLRVFGRNDLTLAGAISGEGGLRLEGGTVTLAGSGHNTFTGTTLVDCGYLQLNKSSNIRAFSGLLRVLTLRRVRWLNNFQLPPDATITMEPSSFILLNNHSDIAADLTFIGGTVDLAADSALQITGLIRKMAPPDVGAFIHGTPGLLFLVGQRTFNIGDGAAANDLQITARMGGSGITKVGNGTLSLGGNNVFAGPVIVSNGVVHADHDNALGTASSGTTVHSGATLWLGANAGTVPEPVTLNGTGFGGTLGALTASDVVYLESTVTLAGPTTIRVDAGSSLNIVGPITGTGPLTKTGGGVLSTSGAGNSYTGDTLIRGGTFNLNKGFAATSVPENLVITDAVVRNFNSYQVIGNITVGAEGLLDVNGHTENVDILTLNSGGDVRTGTGTLIFKTGGALNVVPVPDPRFLSPDIASISGNIDVLPGNLPINVAAGFGFGWTGPELDIPARILSSSGIANLHKQGPGEMHLSGANAFTGVLYINDGRVIAAHNSALGTAQGLTDVRTNGTLVLEGGVTISDFLILETDAAVALSSVGGSNVVTTNINLLRASTGIEVGTGAYLQALGRVGSVGGLTKLGPGTLQFWGFTSNSYAGLTVVSNGVIEAGRVNRISIPGDAIIGRDSSAITTATIRSLREQQFKRTADITIHRSGLLELFPFPGAPAPRPTLNRVLGAGRIDLGAGTSLTISNSPSFTFAGAISGSGALNKYHSDSSMHFTGDSTFSGPTTIFEGFYRMDGSAPSSPVTVKADGSLRGDGRVGALTVEAGGTVNPSSSVPGQRGGDLRMSSANFLDGAILGLAFYGPHPTGGNDSLRVDGAVTLSGTRLSSGFQYAPRKGDVLTLIHKTSAGPASGAFGGYPAGTQRLLGDIPVVASYTGGDGNDVTFTVTNLALRAAGFRIESGNGNGIIDGDECNLIWLGLQSRRNTALTITHAELRTVSSETSVTIAQADYPGVPPLGTGTNLTPFQLRSSAQLQCIGEGVALELQVSVAGEGTFAVPFLLPSGTNCNSSGGGSCDSCIVVAGEFTTNTLASNDRLFFIGAPSDCFPDKPCPGADPTIDLPPARYLTHSFTNSTANDLCITVQLRFDCTNAPVNALGVAAYLGAFDPTAVCANYLGDIGFVGPSAYPPFAFRVPAGSNFMVVVTARTAGTGCDESYALEVFGLACPPPRLHIAKDASPENVLLRWSTAYPGWRLQSVNSLNGSSPFPFQDLSNTPAIVSGHYSVTNPATGNQRIYRLGK